MEQLSEQVGFFRYTVLIVGGWRKEGGKINLLIKKSDMEIDRHNWLMQKSELKTIGT